MKWLLLAVAVVVVAVVVVVVVVLANRNSDDPPAVASGPGVFRVHVQYQSNGGLHAPEAVTYQGTTFKVAFGGAFGSGDTMTAGLTVIGPSGTVEPFAKYPEGATIEVDGAALKVRAIHAGASDLDDVVDVQVIPSGQ